VFDRSFKLSGFKINESRFAFFSNGPSETTLAAFKVNTATLALFV
jgi:hypothetical protein